MKLNEITSRQKVYAVYVFVPYDSSTLYGIYSSKLNAEKAIDSMVDEHTSKKEFSIQEIEINKTYTASDLLN